MKIRSSVVWFAGITCCLIILTIWLARRHTPTTAPATEQITAASLPAESAGGQSSAAEVAFAQPSPPSATNAGASNVTAGPLVPEVQTQAAEMLNVLSNYNDEAIIYYGKLEDQFASPVTNATVDFSIRVINGYESTTRRGAVTSDANGLFTVSGYRGQDLSVNPKKPGYALASTNGWANYSRLFPETDRIHPDPNHPVVIKMWKLQGAEPLVGIDRQFKLHFTDAPIHFDLLTGQVVPSGGDLKVTVNRAPGNMSGRNRLPWSVQVESVGGGLMDSSGRDAITYWAPTDGYQLSRTLTFTPDAWAGGFNVGFFVVSRNGQVYTKLGFSFTINLEPNDPMYLSFHGVANTNSSPNWEADPNTYKPQ